MTAVTVFAVAAHYSLLIKREAKMPTKTQTAARTLKNVSCEQKCYLIIQANSPLYRRDPDAFFVAMTKSNARLRDVEIGSHTADHKVRVMINTAVGSTHPPKSFSDATKIADILIDSCL